MVRIVWVVLLALVLISVASSAFAYRLILIPTVEVLPESVYKMEVSAPFNDNATDKWLPSFKFDSNVAKNFDIAIKGACPAGEWSPAGTLMNLNWQIAKETKDVPGYGMGVWNLYASGSQSAVKESFFVGAFKTVQVGLKFPAKVFLNVGTEQLNGLSGGFALPFSKRFSMAAEWCPKLLRTPGSHSGLVWALGYNQTKNWRFKYANASGDNAYGVVYTSRWFTK